AAVAAVLVAPGCLPADGAVDRHRALQVGVQDDLATTTAKAPTVDFELGGRRRQQVEIGFDVDAAAVELPAGRVERGVHRDLGVARGDADIADAALVSARGRERRVDGNVAVSNQVEVPPVAVLVEWCSTAEDIAVDSI